MDFIKVIEDVCGRFDAAGIRYALIGGFAMAMRGVQRATVDLDLLLALDDLERADAILRARQYACAFRSENVSHYRAEASAFGRIDILHAFRKPALGMLERAERLEIGPGLSVPTARTEDLIGLKIQAAVNDPGRAEQDWLDIRLLLEAAAYNGVALDFELVAEYLEIFGLRERLKEMEFWHGKAE